MVLNFQGKPADALVAMDKAARLDPQNPKIGRERGFAYTQLGRWEDAVAVFKTYLVRYPQAIFWIHVYLAVDYTELGHKDAARAEAAEVLRLYPQFSVDMLFPTNGLQYRRFPHK
jgi:predicted Zn-dependent protease